MTLEYEIKDEEATDLVAGEIMKLTITVACRPDDAGPGQSSSFYDVVFVRPEGADRLRWKHVEPHKMAKRIREKHLGAAEMAADYVEEHYDEEVDTGLIQR
jgi:hypothetical protein